MTEPSTANQSLNDYQRQMASLNAEQIRQNSEAAIVITEGDALFDALWVAIHESAQVPVPDTQALAVIPLLDAVRSPAANLDTP